MAKFDQLSDQLRVRILHGDYTLRSLPAERQLATEHGVSYMTARRAIQNLIDDGLLVRGLNGRVEVNKCPENGKGHSPIALLSPAFDSPGFESWRQQLSRAVEARGGRIQHVLFKHWDDPVISEALKNFEGLFLLPSSESMPEFFIKQLVASDRRITVLDDDLSGVGLPSILPMPPAFTTHLLEYLRAEGFGSIDCLNTQPVHSVIDQRIGYWESWTRKNGISGELINEPVEPYMQPYGRAREVMQTRLREGRFTSEALFCVTAPAAIGAMRALHDAGIRPGHDVGICCLADVENTAEFQIPSLTTIEPGEVTSFITGCLNWMLGEAAVWEGSLLMQPESPRLVERESTTLFRTAARLAA